MGDVLRISNLKKSYDGKLVWENVNFSIDEGEVVGFVGSNGVGKSTLINCILGLVSFDEGEIFYNEDLNYLNSTSAMREIGFLLEIPIFEYLNAFDNLKLVGLYEGINLKKKEIADLLLEVQLDGAKNKKVKGFSFGMQQRLRLAMALIKKRKLLLLDEPTVGLDPKGITVFNEMIVNLAKKHQVAVLISSHQLKDIDDIVDRYILIQDHRIVEKEHILEKHTLIQIDPLTWNDKKMKQLKNGYAIEILSETDIALKNESDLPTILNTISTQSGEILNIEQKNDYSEGIYK